MSNTRALVSCTVLSLQDSCFVYPSCKCCLSRLTRENKRATCARCGFTCDQRNVDYRYRLSLKVSRNKDIFGVTVFGGCLNPFFGITAGDLHRFIELEKSNGPHTVQQQLIKAVEDCFLGRCVVLGLKVSHDDVTTWLADQQSSSLVSKSRQLVAYQIISPSEAFAGFTVFDYFKDLLQSNLHSSHSKSVSSGMCLSQQKDLNSFDYTLPSCARLNSQPSSGEFTLSSVWQSPGLCSNSGEISNDCLKQYTDNDFSSFLPKNEDTSTCQPSLDYKQNCLWSCPLDQLKHIDDVQNELKDEAQSSNGKSKNDSEIMISSHHLFKALSEEQYDAPFDKSYLSHSGPNVCLDVENAPLSENLLDFVRVEPQFSEKVDAKQLRLLNKHSSGKQDEIIQEQIKCSVIENAMLVSNISKTVSAMCNVNKKSWKKINKNDCAKNHEIGVNNADIPKTPKVLCTTSFSGQKKKKMIPRDLNMNFSPDTVSAFHPYKNNRLCFSNKKDLALQRKRLTRSRLSVPFCSLNHEEDNYFRHCAQSEGHSVNCKVKQEQSVFDNHRDMYNCSADLFASCQNSMDLSHSDMTDISKVNGPRNVNTSEPGVSGVLPFSPCLQSTPVSYQHSFRQKTGSQKQVKSLHSRGLELEFKSYVPGLKENRLYNPKVTVSELDRLQIVGSTEGFSDESDVQGKSYKSSMNINEWSKDLFEN